jgi:hypothetical protein
MAGQPFSDADECAMAALDEINPLSIKKNVEFSGRIYRIKTSFYFTRPITQNDTAGVKPPPKIHGTINVGTYHTHAGDFAETDEIFSPEDMLKANMANEYSWLETPYQRILRFTPLRLCQDGQFDPAISGNVEILRNTYVIREVTVVGEPSRP